MWRRCAAGKGREQRRPEAYCSYRCEGIIFLRHGKIRRNTTKSRSSTKHENPSSRYSDASYSNMITLLELESAMEHLRMGIAHFHPSLSECACTFHFRPYASQSPH